MSAANVVDRWVKFFTSLQAEDTQMLRVVSYVLSIPVSNANCERVFSIMNSLWSDSRKRLSLEVVKAELLVKINFNMSCHSFYDFICHDRELLKSAKSQEKYRFKRKP
jgi:hAT family C-terminal dimerisation region